MGRNLLIKITWYSEKSHPQSFWISWSEEGPLRHWHLIDASQAILLCLVIKVQFSLYVFPLFSFIKIRHLFSLSKIGFHLFSAKLNLEKPSKSIEVVLLKFPWGHRSAGDLVKMQIPSQEVWGEAWGSTGLASSQVCLIWEPHLVLPVNFTR